MNPASASRVAAFTTQLFRQDVQSTIIAWMRRKVESARSRRFRRFIRIFLLLLKKKQAPSIRRERRYWIEPRSNRNWFRNDSRLWSEEKWVTNLRMSRASFYKLVDMLKPHIMKHDTHLRPAVPADERVAIALYRLTTNMLYRNIAEHFGRGQATCYGITNEVIDAICKLRSTFIQWPTGDSLRDVINGFYELSKFPMVAGAVDGSHIPVLAPADQRNEYYCYKGFYSINLQGTVDFKGRFINALTGFPGRAHDARVFGASSVYRLGNEGRLFDNMEATLDDVVVRPLLVADSAYPLLPWVMKGYPDNGNLSPAEIEFNTRLNTARNVVERAYGILKARFRSLRKQIDMCVLNAPDLIMACCCLHNYCIDNREVVLPVWEQEAAADERELLRMAREEREQRRAADFDIVDNIVDEDQAQLFFHEDGRAIRNAIKTYINTNIE